MSNYLTPELKAYIQKMQPGETIDIWKTKIPVKLIYAGKEYIDSGGRDIEFNHDYTLIKKL